MRRRGDGERGSTVSLGEGSFTSTTRPAGKGRGGEGSLASAAEPSAVRRRGDGEPGPIVSLGEGSFTSMTRPAGNGLGGEGSAASFSSPVGKRESGSLSSSGFPPSSGYLGKGLGGDGSLAAVYISTSLCGAEGSLSSTGGEGYFTSTMRPAGKGRGGEGS